MNDENVELGADDAQPRREDASFPPSLPGKILSSRRQELNWSVEDVAHSLHLAPRQIVALETDNYSALPGMAVTRGFIRSYAKLLKLDHAPLLQLIPSQTDARAEDNSLRRALPTKPFYPNRSLSLSESPRSWARTAIISLVVIFLFGLLAWKSEWLPASWINEAKRAFSMSAAEIDAGPADTESADTMQNRVEHGLASADAGQQPVPADLDSNRPDAVPAPAAGGAPQDRDALQNQVGTQPAGVIGQSPGLPDAKDALVLTVREDSWIEIRNARDKIILSRLAKAGESEVIPVREAIKLKIGNAAGVDARLRGVPVELSASSKNNVARLTVN